MTRSFVLLLLAATTSLTACNPFGGGNSHCDFRPGRDQCTDWRNTTGPDVVQKAVCDTLKGTGSATYGTGTCSTIGMLGGCQASMADGSKQTNWFYQGSKYATPADVQKECDSDMTFVTPQ